MSESKNPLVTIAIPVYNVGRFIDQTIKSVLNQSYTNFELIITDDGSTDNTIEKIQQFEDSRIRLIIDGENHGISYRLNQQIALAKGEIFVRMDGDDLMFPSRVERQVEFLQNHPEIDVVGSSAIIIGDENELIGIRRVRNKEQTVDSILKSSSFIHPTVAGRICWFRKWLYREEMNGVEDIDLWLRSCESSRFYIIEEPLMYYRDPLRFKLSTYIYRLNQRLRLVLSHRHRAKSKVIWTYCLPKTFISIFIACILSIIGKDKVMIARRNQVLSMYENKIYEIKNGNLKK